MWCEKGGDRAVVHCYKGSQRSSACVARAGKTLKQIEDSLLNHLLSELESKSFLDDLLAKANAYIAELASLPAIDVGPLQVQIERKQSARDRIIKRLAQAEDDQMLDRIFEMVTKLEKEIEELKSQIKQSAVDEASLAAIGQEDLQAIIGSLRDLLYEDVALAGSVLVALVGPVKLMQSEPLPGKKRCQWTAEFMFNHAKVFVEIARQRNCPSTKTWEFLSNRSWTIGTSHVIEVRTFKNAERLAKTAFEMRSSGTNVNAVAIALGVDPETIESAIALWEAGVRCSLPPKDYRFRRDLPASKVARIRPDVVRMVDEEKMSLAAIAKKLGVSETLASRAYKQAKGDQLVSMAKAGKPMKIPAPLRLSPETHKRIRELLLAGGMSYRAIAREVGCDHHAVSEAHKRMKAEGDA
jgi:transposase-like protein